MPVYVSVPGLLWGALGFSSALTVYGLWNGQKNRWWAFLVAGLFSAYFTAGALSIALLVGLLSFLQFSWALSSLPGLRRVWSSAFGAGAWALWVAATLTHAW